jgi:hypothetical protein
LVGIRDAKFLASINSELINAIIDTEIEFFKLIVEQVILIYMANQKKIIL